jgi:hypothetical protein
LACLWIFQNRDWLKDNTSGVLLVQTRDKSSTVPREQLPSKHRRWLARGLDGILTPISGVRSARSSTTWYRNDAAVAALSQVFPGGEIPFFTTVVFELSIEATLVVNHSREASEIEGCQWEPITSPRRPARLVAEATLS